MATLASTYVSDGSPRRALCRTYVSDGSPRRALRLLKLEERATGQPILNRYAYLVLAAAGMWPEKDRLVVLRSRPFDCIILYIGILHNRVRSDLDFGSEPNANSWVWAGLACT
jgi:hypothetical protein